MNREKGVISATSGFYSQDDTFLCENVTTEARVLAQVVSNGEVESLANTSRELQMHTPSSETAVLIVGHVYQKLSRRKLDLMLAWGLFKLDVCIDRTASVSIRSSSIWTLPVIILVATCTMVL